MYYTNNNLNDPYNPINPMEESKRQEGYSMDGLNFTPYMYDYSMPQMDQLMYDSQMMSNYNINPFMGDERAPMGIPSYRPQMGGHGGFHGNPHFFHPFFFHPVFFHPRFRPWPWWFFI